MRNRNTPNSPAPEISTDRYEPPRLRSSTIRSGSSGWGARRSITTNTTSKITPAISDPSVSQSVQPRGSACEKPKTIRNRPSDTATAPGMSNCGRSDGTWLVSSATAANTAGTAITTFTYRHQRHDRYSVSTPPSSRPTAPPAPATAP